MDHLHVLFCIFVLCLRAALYADLGADNQDNLDSLRCPSFHIALSTLRAMVKIFADVTLPFLSLFLRLDTSPQCLRVTRRWGVLSTNQRRTALDPSLIFAASKEKCGTSNIRLSSPMFTANIAELQSKLNISLNTVYGNRHFSP